MPINRYQSYLHQKYFNITYLFTYIIPVSLTLTLTLSHLDFIYISIQLNMCHFGWNNFMSSTILDISCYFSLKIFCWWICNSTYRQMYRPNMSRDWLWVNWKKNNKTNPPKNHLLTFLSILHTFGEDKQLSCINSMDTDSFFRDNSNHSTIVGNCLF